jgi:DNA-binding transcriptional ArsR family regulator
MSAQAREASDSVSVLDARAAGLALAPIRRRILELLDEPSSATRLAERIGMPRQRVNYHLRALERGGLIALVERRQRRGFEERLYGLCARELLVDPGVLGGASPRGEGLGLGLRERFSSANLLRVAARLVRDVAFLRERAKRARKRLFTATAEAELGFETPADAERFAAELTQAIARLAKKHGGSRGRRFRLVLALHPERKTGGVSER